MDDTRWMTLPMRLDWLMATQALTRRQLAERAGLSAPSVNTIYKKGGASANVIMHIAKATGARVDWLATGAGQPFADQPGATASPADAARYFAAAVGIDPGSIDSVCAQALPGTRAEVLFDRMRIADAQGRLGANAPHAATYEAAAAFARAHGVPTASVVAVREEALAGRFTSPFECFLAMRDATSSTSGPTFPTRPLLPIEELADLGYDAPRKTAPPSKRTQP